MVKFHSSGLAGGHKYVGSYQNLVVCMSVVSRKAKFFALLLKFWYRQMFASGVDTINTNAVVVGLAPPQFDYQHMNDAFRCA